MLNLSCEEGNPGMGSPIVLSWAADWPNLQCRLASLMQSDLEEGCDCFALQSAVLN